MLVSHACLNIYVFSFFIKIDLLCFCFFIGKAAIDRMTSDMATELRAKNKSIAVISMYPGVVRTEKILNRAKIISDNLSASMDSHCMRPFSFSKLSLIFYFLIVFLPPLAESPELTGRIIARIAMETREELLKRSGRTVIVADAANSLGICDIDGRSPISFRSYK